MWLIDVTKRRPKNAGMLRSYLMFQSFIFEARSARALEQSQVQHLRSTYPSVPPWGSLSISTTLLFSLTPPGQFLLEESRLLEAAEMAEKAARLDDGEFDVVFSAAHMLRWVSGGGVLFPFSSNGMIPTAAPGGTEHMSYFVAKMDEPEFSMAEQKGGNIKQREFFSQKFIFLLIQYDLLSCTL